MTTFACLDNAGLAIVSSRMKAVISFADALHDAVITWCFLFIYT